MAYYVGDIPSEDLVIEPARNGEQIDLGSFVEEDTELVLRTFDGEVVPADFLASFGTDDSEGLLIIEWPAASVFEASGLYTLAVTLVGDDVRERLAPVYFVAQEENGWHTLDSARDEWEDAPAEDVNLFRVLELARQQVVAYAPALADDAAIPYHYRAGQLAQGRNILNASQVSPSGEVGTDTFVLTPHPLDWHVEQTLRPKRAVPKVH